MNRSYIGSIAKYERIATSIAKSQSIATSIATLSKYDCLKALKNNLRKDASRDK